ncbi:hypothetical protein [Abyssicoccus albus]|uniref:hypothetical protein n=1 Tax=Abyssicoccus albus TaxID=1817405 RepID=UPI00097E2FC6|nr:hypothetical protein [Abyssicoccus albus]AQL55474.1 hypothetical protein BVH56_00200 [Abyssicoccus albus]
MNKHTGLILYIVILVAFIGAMYLIMNTTIQNQYNDDRGVLLIDKDLENRNDKPDQMKEIYDQKDWTGASKEEISKRFGVPKNIKYEEIHYGNEDFSITFELDYMDQVKTHQFKHHEYHHTQ